MYTYHMYILYLGLRNILYTINNDVMSRVFIE
jgi:hypothetical protein